MLDLEPIKTRLAKATPAPWEEYINDDGIFGVRMDSAHEIGWDLEGSCDKCSGNMHLIANAPSDLAILIAEIERLRKALRGWLAWTHVAAIDRYPMELRTETENVLKEG